MAGEEGAAKRKAEADGPGDAEAKRQRVDGAAPAAAAPKKLGIDLEKLQRAKEALRRQKELAERLKKAGVKVGVKTGAAAPAAAAPAAAAAAGAAAPAAAAAAPAAAPKPTTRLPPPLILDEQGREVDSQGRPIEKPASAQAQQAAQQAAQQQAAQQQEADAAKFFDPGLGSRGLQRLQRRPRASFQFVEEGKMQKQAEMGRLRAQYGDGAARQLAERRKAEAALGAAGGDANLVPLGQRAEAAPAEEPKPAQEPLPEVEWWDARILADKTSYGAVLDGQPAQLHEGRITIYIEHPVLLEPPAEAPPPPPQPLKLTKRELKKMRTQRRVAREKEKQELVRQGLLEPPAPKVKISNLMRVLGAEATADPTQVEAEVRRQMAERAAAHEDRNLARMLTPAERRDKKLRKLVGEDDGLQKHVALYKVGDLSNTQIRFKVDVNARENHMTGCSLAVAGGAFGLVAVEGTQKTLRRYEKLMLRRIDWNAGREEEEEEAEEAGGGKPPRPPNYCHLVWQGVVKEPHFRRFRSETAQSEGGARKMLQDAGVGHYWELCEAFTTE